jgi:hypothetical protein
MIGVKLDDFVNLTCHQFRLYHFIWNRKLMNGAQTFCQLDSSSIRIELFQRSLSNLIRIWELALFGKGLGAILSDQLVVVIYIRPFWAVDKMASWPNDLAPYWHVWWQQADIIWNVILGGKQWVNTLTFKVQVFSFCLVFFPYFKTTWALRLWLESLFVKTQFWNRIGQLNWTIFVGCINEA